MSDKQGRYRKHKAEQGFHRVEVLVPAESVEHLKAYVRALRDAHRLGSAIPLFEGMTPGRSPHRVYSTNIQSTPPPVADARPLSADPSKSKPRRPTRPDFSRGILGPDTSES